MSESQPSQTHESKASSTTDSQKVLKTIAELNVSAQKIRSRYPEKARKLYEQALKLSAKNELFLSEKAASIAGMAFLSHKNGEVDIAVKQNFDAISLIVKSSTCPALIDAYTNLAWIFYTFGDFSGALEYASKAIKAAEDVGDKFWLAMALDTYGFCIFSDANDINEASTYQEKSIRILGEIESYNSQARVYNNLADTHMRANNLEIALSHAEKSFELATKISSPYVKTLASGTYAEILIRMGKFSQAKRHLEKVSDEPSDEVPIMFKAFILLSLAKIYIKEAKSKEAKSSLLKAIEIFQSIKSISQLSTAHQMLFEIYEQEQDYVQAIACMKVSSELNEKILRERSSKQLYANKFVAKLEIAQRDAEIYRLQNIELQNEIEQQKDIQKNLEVEATIDPLTGLYNRRGFSRLAKNEIRKANANNHPLTLVLIDIDDFKTINDTFGHPVGDLVLEKIADVIRKTLRSIDITCRCGGDEFAILTPETNALKSRKAILRVQEALAHLSLPEINAHPIKFSAGIATYTGENDTPNLTLDTLFKSTDEALYKAKRAGKNEICIFNETG